MRRDAAIVLVGLVAAAGAVERLMRERSWDQELRRSVEAAVDECEEELAIVRDTHPDRLLETARGSGMTRVVNLRHEEAEVVIDRRSQWGNPFRIGRQWGYTREESIAAYREWLLERLKLDEQFGEPLRFLEPLRGKVLGCWCKPLPCHGDVIVELLGEAA